MKKLLFIIVWPLLAAILNSCASDQSSGATTAPSTRQQDVPRPQSNHPGMMHGGMG